MEQELAKKISMKSEMGLVYHNEFVSVFILIPIKEVLLFD